MTAPGVYSGRTKQLRNNLVYCTYEGIKGRLPKDCGMVTYPDSVLMNYKEMEKKQKEIRAKYLSRVIPSSVSCGDFYVRDFDILLDGGFVQISNSGDSIKLYHENSKKLKSLAERLLLPEPSVIKRDSVFLAID